MTIVDWLILKTLAQIQNTLGKGTQIIWINPDSSSGKVLSKPAVNIDSSVIMLVANTFELTQSFVTDSCSAGNSTATSHDLI